MNPHTTDVLYMSLALAQAKRQSQAAVRLLFNTMNVVEISQSMLDDDPELRRPNT